MTARGIRNNNPGNLRHGNAWKGLAPKQPDKGFATFIDPLWGLRAMAKVLLVYSTRHGRRTVRAIIERWAPTSENDTDAYVAMVSRAMGVGPDAPLDLTKDMVLSDLMRAIIQHENGVQPYHPGLILSGIREARSG
jgi:hypothetical protein